MIKIGDFSKLSRISVRMLRHYDEKGLLHPVKIDDFTGYRYYSEEQLTIANRITCLKNMGFKLATVKEILDIYNNPIELKKYLEIKQIELEEEVKESNSRLTLIESTIDRLGKDSSVMNYSVTLKTMPERTVMSCRQIIPAYEEEGLLWHHIMKAAKEQNIKFANPCNSMAIFHDGEFKESDVDVEVQIDVNKAYEGNNYVSFKNVGEIKCASTTFKGGYDQIHDACKSIALWVKDNNYTFNGNMFEIYHVGPHTEQNPANWVTEVCFPVK